MKRIILLFMLVSCSFLHAAEKPDFKKLGEIFDKKGQWCFFTISDSKYNRLTYADKNMYKICREGDLFKTISYKGKSYARGMDNKIYKPHWQMKNGFDTHLIPAKKYFVMLDGKIKSLKQEIQKDKREIKKTEDYLKNSQDKYEKYSEYKKHANFKGRFSSKVSALKKIHKKKIDKYEDEIDELNKKIKAKETELQTQETFKTKTQTLYKKYMKANK